MSKYILQKIKKNNGDKFLMAQKYYSIISVLNDLRLTERETQLVAFCAIRGNMSYANVREDFCKKYKTSFPTINNMISRMKKIGVFMKESGKIKVVPPLALNFDENEGIVMEVGLWINQ